MQLLTPFFSTLLSEKQPDLTASPTDRPLHQEASLPESFSPVSEPISFADNRRPASDAFSAWVEEQDQESRRKTRNLHLD